MSPPPDPASARGRARACGLALLDASASYETRTVPADQSGLALMLALVGRARRLLRAAYLLAHSGLELEASGPRRALIEYLLRMYWLLDEQDKTSRSGSATTRAAG